MWQDEIQSRLSGSFYKIRWVLDVYINSIFLLYKKKKKKWFSEYPSDRARLTDDATSLG